jgi:hypothetical protein
VNTGHGRTAAITQALMDAIKDGSEQSLILDKAYSHEAAVVALRKVVGSLNGAQGA